MTTRVCRECARLQDTIRPRQQQLDTAVRLFDDHLAGLDVDNRIVIQAGASVRTDPL